MDFERVVKTLLDEFAQQQIRYAAIGGFALGALGVPRATADLDFLVHRDDLDRLHQALSRLGYVRRIQTENVSHYRHPEQAWGAVDFLHAFREIALSMLSRTRALPIFGGTQTIRVLEPEDLIGLKVQAMANDPLRQSRETADIEALLARYGPQVNWQRIEEFFALFDLTEDAKRLKERFGNAQ